MLMKYWAYLGSALLIVDLLRYTPKLYQMLQTKYTRGLQRLIDYLRSLEEVTPPVFPIALLSLTVSIETIPHGVIPMTISNQTLRIDQSLKLTVADAKDVKGNLVEALPNTITWAVADPSMLIIAPSADTLSAIVTPVGPLGNTSVTYSTNTDPVAADAPLVVTGTVNVTIAAGLAVQFDVTASVSDSGADAAALNPPSPAPAPVASTPVTSPSPAPVNTPAPSPAPTDSPAPAPVDAPAPAPVSTDPTTTTSTTTSDPSTSPVAPITPVTTAPFDSSTPST